MTISAVEQRIRETFGFSSAAARPLGGALSCYQRGINCRLPIIGPFRARSDTPTRRTRPPVSPESRLASAAQPSLSLRTAPPSGRADTCSTRGVAAARTRAVMTPNFGLVTGRVSSIAIDPADSTGNRVYIGTTGGGVWASQNAAASSNIAFSPLRIAHLRSIACATPPSASVLSRSSPAAREWFWRELAIPTTHSIRTTAPGFCVPPMAVQHGP